MASILELIKEFPLSRYEPGEFVFEQGTSTGKLFVLAEGAVEIIKNGSRVAVAREPGSVLGDIALFHQSPHTVTARVIEPAAFHVVENARQIVEGNPALCFQLCGTMAGRLDALIEYLADLKEQYSGSDFLGMVEGVLECLMRRQTRVRIRPSESTLRKG